MTFSLYFDQSAVYILGLGDLFGFDPPSSCFCVIFPPKMIFKPSVPVSLCQTVPDSVMCLARALLGLFSVMLIKSFFWLEPVGDLFLEMPANIGFAKQNYSIANFEQLLFAHGTFSTEVLTPLFYVMYGYMFLLLLRACTFSLQ